MGGQCGSGHLVPSVFQTFAHLTQENFLGLEYFLFSLYSTVLNTFGFDLDFSLLAEVSIFIVVPSTI